MVKRLLLLRHAEAAPASAGDDFARPLTARGQADARALGLAMARRMPAPASSFVSPARRTVETFDALIAGTGWAVIRRFEPALYEATPESVLAIVTAAEPAESVLVVGHNPTLAELATACASRGEPRELARLQRQFPAPCLAALVFEASTWDAVDPTSGRLDCFLTPDAL